jgi:hypothetical protein
MRPRESTTSNLPREENEPDRPVEHHRSSSTGFGRTLDPDEREDFRGGHNEPDKSRFRSEAERQYVRHFNDFYDGPGEPAPRHAPKGYVRHSSRLYESVCELLADSGVDASDITVRVEGTEVWLEGTVKTRLDKRRAEDVALSIAGVDDVHVRLLLRP